MKNTSKIKNQTLAILFLGSLAGLAHATTTIDIIGRNTLSGFAIELEVTEPSLISVDISNSGTMVSLEKDTGENQFNLYSGGYTLTELNGLISSVTRFTLSSDLGTGVYDFTGFNSFNNSDFAVAANSLNISTNENALRPTANWVGGDINADAMIITYTDLMGNDFNDGILTPTKNASHTLGFDLAEGIYEVTHGYYNLISSSSFFSKVSGDNVIDLSDVEIRLITASDITSSVSINAVPLPSAAWLFGSVLIGLLRFKKKV